MTKKIKYLYWRSWAWIWLHAAKLLCKHRKLWNFTIEKGTIALYYTILYYDCTLEERCEMYEHLHNVFDLKGEIHD